MASNVGTWMHRIAQSWLVLMLTADPRMLGLVVAAQFAPMLFLAPWAGVLADRYDRRRLLAITQVGMGLQALGLGLLVLTGHATGPLVLVAAAILGIFTAVDGPARQSIVSDLVPADQVVNAVALNSANFNAARLLGPAVAGLMIAAWGPGWVFMVNAATFAVMFLALSRIRLAPRNTGRRVGGMRDGLRYVRGRPDLWFVIALAGSVAMLLFNFPITIALMVSDEFAADARSYGILASLMAVGSLLAALVQARRARTDLRLVTIAAGLAALTTILAGLMPSVPTFAAALIANGAAALTMMTGANSYLQTRSDDDHRSRVMSLYMAVFFGTTPIGAPVIGLLADEFGPRAALVIPGVASLIVTGLLVTAYRAARSAEGVRAAPSTNPISASPAPAITR
ncbi:MAG TPA: MFS transporter [Actinomycetota bacterium]|nr:MFS transporter [Actinomycetota bacterium]